MRVVLIGRLLSCVLDVRAPVRDQSVQALRGYDDAPSGPYAFEGGAGEVIEAEAVHDERVGLLKAAHVVRRDHIVVGAPELGWKEALDAESVSPVRRRASEQPQGIRGAEDRLAGTVRSRRARRSASRDECGYERGDDAQGRGAHDPEMLLQMRLHLHYATQVRYRGAEVDQARLCPEALK
jgi:hypothetical protein